MDKFDFKKMDYKKYPEESITLSNKNMELLKNAIVKNLHYSDFRKKINTDFTSYGLKHIFEEIIGFYISNMDFKEAMKQLDIPNDGKMDKMNVCYPIKTSAYKRLQRLING